MLQHGVDHRNRIFSGEALMSVWSGFENGVRTANMSPAELAPANQQQLQWPKFGQYGTDPIVLNAIVLEIGGNAQQVKGNVVSAPMDGVV